MREEFEIQTDDNLFPAEFLLIFLTCSLASLALRDITSLFAKSEKFEFLHDLFLQPLKLLFAINSMED